MNMTQGYSVNIFVCPFPFSKILLTRQTVSHSPSNTRFSLLAYNHVHRVHKPTKDHNAVPVISRFTPAHCRENNQSRNTQDIRDCYLLNHILNTDFKQVILKEIDNVTDVMCAAFFLSFSFSFFSSQMFELYRAINDVYASETPFTLVWKI